MTSRHAAMNALSQIVAEHDAARKAVAMLLSRAEGNPTLLHDRGPSQEDLRICLRNLERTYLVRLFALFEDGLRQIWLQSFGKPTTPPMKDLIDGCTARRAVTPDDLRTRVHEVREYRNSVLHGTPAPIVALADSKSRLCRFLAWMPEDW